MTEFRIGTSAFTAAGWETAFYPAGMKPADNLSYYATKFNTVEVDSTFYRTPSVAKVNGWAQGVPVTDCNLGLISVYCLICRYIHVRRHSHSRDANLS
jgi:hypothetical protein